MERRAAQEQAHAMQVAGPLLTNMFIPSPDVNAVKSLLEEMLAKLAALPPGGPTILELQKTVHDLEQAKNVCSADEWRGRVTTLVVSAGAAVGTFPTISKPEGKVAFFTSLGGVGVSTESLFECVVKAVGAP